MKKSKTISLLLSLSLLASTVALGTLAVPAYAAEEAGKGMEIRKTATPNGDGSYTITLEAYATGEQISTEVTKDVPTDIVLVLDQSGSMSENMNTYGFQAYTGKSNNDYYNIRHNGAKKPNLYYKLEDGSYATVSVQRSQSQSNTSYTVCPDRWTNGAFWGNDNYYANKNNLYVLQGETYQKVTVSRDWIDDGILQGYYRYTYTFPDGSIYVSDRYDTSPGTFDGKGPLYVLSTTQEYSYTYSYTDKDGVSNQIGTSDGANTRPTDFVLYERYSTGSTTRLEALKTAVTGFSNAVATKAAGTDGQLGTGDDVDHRIAVVGYASNANYNWVNTELFIGAAQHNLSVDASSYYGSAFQHMSTVEGQNNVKASIGVLAAEGATYTNYGLEMANGILNTNPVPANEKRNRVIILFSDGYPGRNADNFDRAAANAALEQAATAKNNGVSVYSVGIFNGADATSAGDSNGNNTQAANWFMQQVSSNNGTPRNPSYYLSASDADTLNNIFQQISDNIESGGSSIDLGVEAVIQDIISPQFQLPTGAAEEVITLKTYRYTGKNQWSENSNAMGATAAVNGDKVSVSGFDFKENWCGTETNNGEITYRGNKLEISFPVVVKDGFLGGNGVYTNISAGVYENSSEENPLFSFDRPQVDVAIQNITVTAEEKNVYLLGDLTADQIKDGASVQVGNTELKLSEENYGLESWQNDYVDITVTYQDDKGQIITELNDLTDDTTYKVIVTVEPKDKTGTATAQSNNATGNINVFKPTMTYKDSSVYYGADEPVTPDNYTAENYVNTQWFHTQNGVTTEDKYVTMAGSPDATSPVLSIDYTPDASKIKDGKINTKEDIPVKVDVKILDTPINEYITFKHQACHGPCDWNKSELDDNAAFLLHVMSCQLTITKQGGTSDEPYVFDVYKDAQKYSEVTIVGNTSETIIELPVGTYTIVEDENWSWRYDGINGSSAVLTAESPEGQITCTNSKSENNWLNGFSDVVKNIFGVSHSN